MSRHGWRPLRGLSVAVSAAAAAALAAMAGWSDAPTAWQVVSMVAAGILTGYAVLPLPAIMSTPSKKMPHLSNVTPNGCDPRPASRS